MLDDGNYTIVSMTGAYTLEYNGYYPASTQHGFLLGVKELRILHADSNAPSGIEVGGNGTYTEPFIFIVVYSVPTYTVTWKNENDTVLETDTGVEKGTTPVYNGVTPIKAATAQYAYTFSGWRDGTTVYAPDAFPAVTGDVIYTAAFAQGGAPHTHDGVVFTAWPGTTSLPTTAGNYCLTADVTLGSSWNVPAGTTNLCLNGHGIKAVHSGYSVITVGAGSTLNLYECDTVTEHRFSVADAVANGAGRGVVNDALASGYQTFTGGYITGGLAGHGAGVDVYGTFRMYGGTIIGNETAANISGTVVSSNEVNGAGVRVSDGTFALYGGSVMYNFAHAHGGGVYVESSAGNTARMVMSGGEVAYNAAYGENSTNFRYGGGGMCSRYYSGDVVYDLTGGAIHHNAGMEWAGGINVNGTSGHCALHIGGTVQITDNYGNEGGIRVSVVNNTTTFSGAPLIDRNMTKSGTECNFFVNSNATVIKVVGELTNTTPIGVTQKSPGAAFTRSEDTSLNDLSKFVYENATSTPYTLIKNGYGQLASAQVYTVTWNNWNGTQLATDSVAASLTPVYSGATPTKAADAQNVYTFSGWSNGTTTYAPDALPAVTGNVTYTAVFTSVPTVNVTVEFGTGHAAFAQTYFGGIAGMTVSGTTGTLIVAEGTTVSEARGMLFGPIFEDGIPMNAFYDSGEYFLSNFGLQPAGSYASRSALSDELNEAGSSPVPAGGITFYAQWAQPVGAVTITVTPPAAGTVIGTTGSGAMSRSDPSVEATITGNAEFSTDSGSIGNLLTGIGDSSFYTGTVANGQACYASMYVTPKYGYFFGYHDANSEFQMAPGTSVSVTNDANAQILPVGSMMQVNAAVYAVGKANDRMSVSVDDQIHLNLYLDLEFRSKTVNDVTIAFGGKTYACKGTKETGGTYDGLYKFKVEMAPAQIADAIAVTINGDADPLTTSVTAYCSALQNPVYSATDAEKALGLAILDYGQAANNMFADGTTVFAAEIANLSTMDKDAVQSASVTFTDGTGAVTGALFMALTKPEFRFYTADIDEQTAYEYNQAGITVTMANASQEQKNALNARFVKKANGDVLLEVTGVLAENMDKEITVTIHGLEEGHNTITFNGNAFAKAMAKSGTSAQADLGASLYNYGAAAKTCFGA